MRFVVPSWWLYRQRFSQLFRALVSPEGPGASSTHLPSHCAYATLGLGQRGLLCGIWNLFIIALMKTQRLKPNGDVGGFTELNLHSGRSTCRDFDPDSDLKGDCIVLWSLRIRQILKVVFSNEP
jgi:hypothetical protein